jgi:uroporphyrinogen-III synthase
MRRYLIYVAGVGNGCCYGERTAVRLEGKHVVNTRAAHQAEPLDALLRAEGALPLHYPAIRFAPPERTQVLDEALAAAYDWLVLTSTNTVEVLAERAQALGMTLAGRKTAAVGAATAQAAKDKLGIDAAFVPTEANAQALAAQLPLIHGARVLLPQSELAGTALADALHGRGASVNVVTAYRTVKGTGGVELAPLLSSAQVDAVTFTSASTVRYFAERLADEGAGLPQQVRVVCMSTQISAAARAAGYMVSAEARAQTLNALVDALVECFA